MLKKRGGKIRRENNKNKMMMEGQTRPRRDGESEREQGQRVRSEVVALCVALSEHGRRRDPFTKRQMGERERDGGRERGRENHSINSIFI